MFEVEHASMVDLCDTAARRASLIRPRRHRAERFPMTGSSLFATVIAKHSLCQDMVLCCPYRLDQATCQWGEGSGADSRENQGTDTNGAAVPPGRGPGHRGGPRPR